MAAIPFSVADSCMRLSDFVRPQAVQETSVVAYYEAAREGVLGVQASRIYDALRAAPDGLSNQEISARTGVRINAVCGRVNELRKAGLVVCGGLRLNQESNKQNMVWVVAR